MAYTTINKHTDFFNTKLYTGTGAELAVTGVGFQPDFTWLKSRSVAEGHYLQNAVRGATKFLHTNNSDAEVTGAQFLKSFDTDGFTVGTESDINTNNSTNVSWNWKAGGGQGSSNTDGSINTTYTSVNTTAGFSISTYTGNGSAGATIGHGLGAVPDVVIVKKLSGTSDWSSYHSVLGNTGYMRFNNTNAFATASTYWNDTTPTSTVFTAGTTGNINGSGADYVAYCFAAKKGYSKFGSYTGNGNTNGTFIYTGFRPSFLLLKQTNTGGQTWRIFDSKRDPGNFVSRALLPNANDVEETAASAGSLDFLSNGFKLRSDYGSRNASGGTYVYMAFGQSLVGSNNVCSTAY
tara:strand:+ start:265 stop:1311 length:1047 start_codon:yes stop_codon:yes gene_type:complete